MKKRITLILETETDDEFLMKDEFIRDDLETEINCASNSYEIVSIEIASEWKLYLISRPQSHESGWQWGAEPYFGAALPLHCTMPYGMRDGMEPDGGMIRVHYPSSINTVR